MKIYKGKRNGDEVEITVEEDGGAERPLKHIVRHSPTGMTWGYLGSGLADLALSILTDLLGEEPPRPFYMEFKERVIAKLRQGYDWVLTSEDITKALHDILPEYMRRYVYGSRNIDRIRNGEDIFYCGAAKNIKDEEHAIELGLFKALELGYDCYALVDGVPRVCMPLPESSAHRGHRWQYGKSGVLRCECGADLGQY